MAAEIRFRRRPLGRWFSIGNLRVLAVPVPHPGECYAFRVEDNACSLVYATDLELRPWRRGPEAACVWLAREADLLIFDAHHGAGGLRGWGHSNAAAAARIAGRAGARRLALFHHDPRAGDDALARGLERARRELERLRANCEVFLAREDEVVGLP